MEFEKYEKDIEITIKLNKCEAEWLKQIIWFAEDYDAEQRRFTERERELANELHDLLEKAGC